MRGGGVVRSLAQFRICFFADLRLNVREKKLPTMSYREFEIYRLSYFETCQGQSLSFYSSLSSPCRPISISFTARCT